MSDLEILNRWSLTGGDWKVIELDYERAVVALRSCTGEVLERLESHDSALIEFLRTVYGSEG